MYSCYAHIQPNLLKSHGRDFCRFLFIGLNDNTPKERIRAGIADLFFANHKPFQVINSLEKQLEESERRIQNKQHTAHTTSIVMTLHLSALGLNKIQQQHWCSPSEHTFFNKGMKDQFVSKALSDPHPTEWESPYRQPIDLLIEIASDTLSSLDDFEQKLTFFLLQKGIGHIQFVEQGKKLYWGKDAIEPFGFKDNITTPTFFKKKIGHTPIYQKNEATKLNIILDKRGGSFLVFRKLEQDVLAFNEKVHYLSRRLAIPISLAEAQIMGRFKDGTPLDLSDKPGVLETEVSRKTFDEDYKTGYSGDLKGLRCPLHAHVRRANPRSDRSCIIKHLKYDPNRELDRDVIGVIVRRGIPYENPGVSQGLLFLCYQASIDTQFVAIQQEWSNNGHQPDCESDSEFSKMSIGLDPIAGQYRNVPSYRKNIWNKSWGVKNERAKNRVELEVDFTDLVYLKGGAFLYTPSIPDLMSLYPKKPNATV
ncbi:MAG: hypothetical protein AAF798_10025 [Bacteroidota bacterium]